MSNSSKRWSKQVIYFPFDNRDNAYNEINRELISSLGFQVVDIYKLPRSKLLTKHYVIANWLESHCVNNSGGVIWKNTLKIAAMLLFIVASQSRLIYVRHNHTPHGARGLALRLAKLIVRLQEKLAYVKLSHFPEKSGEGYKLLPHPLYQTAPYSEDDHQTRCRFSIVGSVDPYKKIDEILQNWPPNIELVIAGKPSSSEYQQRLEAIASAKQLNVKFILKRLSDPEMITLLSDSEVVVVAHDGQSAIVSGTYYLAKTAGCLTLSRRAHGPANCKGDYVFQELRELSYMVHSIADNRTTRCSRREVFNAAELHYGQKRVAEFWDSYLC